MKNKIVSSLAWTFSERFFSQGITFIISIILARLLKPEEYGIISIVLVLVNLSNVFVISGFGEALIQKKIVKSIDFSTIFWCSLFLSFILYSGIYLIAPFLEKIYKIEQITLILRILALKIIISSVNTIQRAYIFRRMEFKKFFFSTSIGTVISGIFGIIWAYRGYGIWALVGQYLLNSLLEILILFIIVKWRPKFSFNWMSAKLLMKYSWKITGAAFINSLYSEARTLIIGSFYTPTDLAYYNRGNQFPSLLVVNINSAIGIVFFPVMSKLQNNKEELKVLVRQTIIVSSYVIFPILMGLMGVSKILVLLILTEKWLNSVFYLNILSFYWMTLPIQSINWQVLKALGRSDVCLKLELVKKVIGFSLILVTMFVSVKLLAISTAIFAIISTIINMNPNKKLINYSFKEQIKDIFKNFFMASCTGIFVYILGVYLNFSLIFIFFIQVFMGIFIYLSLSIIFKAEGFILLIKKVKLLKN